MNTPGYSITRYQGESIIFDALSRAIQLTTKAIVQKDSQLVKSDTITYTGTGNSIRVGSAPGKRNVMVTPGQAPIFDDRVRHLRPGDEASSRAGG